MKTVCLLWYASFPDHDLEGIFESFDAAVKFVEEEYIPKSRGKWTSTAPGRWKDEEFLSYLFIEEKEVIGCSDKITT